MRVYLTRHAVTAANERHAYVGGSLDEPLSERGRACACDARVRSGVARVYTSGMLRTRQTAELLYPDAAHIAVPDMREMEFGLFEGKNAEDMRDMPAYRSWVEGGCTGRCPGGESREGFVRRCVAAFARVMVLERARVAREVHFVVHGGTVMALLHALCEPAREYFDWRCEPLETWCCTYDGSELHLVSVPASARERLACRESAGSAC